MTWNANFTFNSYKSFTTSSEILTFFTLRFLLLRTLLFLFVPVPVVVVVADFVDFRTFRLVFLAPVLRLVVFRFVLRFVVLRRLRVVLDLARVAARVAVLGAGA